MIGLASGRARCWKGIRYAAPPVRGLRWRAPQPPQPWTEPYQATDFGPACPQPPNPAIGLPEGTAQDEDCLSLNVWASADCTPEHPGPVMVWVHGGAYVFGSSCQPLFDATSMVSVADLVVVTVNYRLGALGFLDLTGIPGGDDAPAFDSNLGLRDVLAALEWVRDNIAGFGGDASRVTLAGESAGGGIVTTMLAVPAAAGLFHRAISESSPATSVYGTGRSRTVAELFLDKVGLSADRIADVRDLPVETVVEAGLTVFQTVPRQFPGTLAFAPTVDGSLVPEHPLDAIRAGRAHPVPLLIGTNRDESAMFKFMSSPLLPTTPTAVGEMLTGLAADASTTVPTRAQLQAAYPHLRTGARDLAIDRDLAFRMPAVWIAQAHAQHAPVYLFRFDWATPMFRLIGLGATHATELPYLWGNLVSGPKDITFRLGGLATGRRISARMQARWLAFVCGNSPDAPNAPAWPGYQVDATDGGPARQTLVIDHHDHVVPDLDATLRSAWGETVLGFR